MSSVNKDGLLAPFPIYMPVIIFSGLMVLTRMLSVRWQWTSSPGSQP